MKRRTKCYFLVHLLQEEKMTFDYGHLSFFNFSTCLLFKLFLCLFFGFQIDCDEEGTRIVKCSIKMTKKDNKKVLSSSALLL